MRIRVTAKAAVAVALLVVLAVWLTVPSSPFYRSQPSNVRSSQDSEFGQTPRNSPTTDAPPLVEIEEPHTHQSTPHSNPPLVNDVTQENATKTNLTMGDWLGIARLPTASLSDAGYPKAQVDPETFRMSTLPIVGDAVFFDLGEGVALAGRVTNAFRDATRSSFGVELEGKDAFGSVLHVDFNGKGEVAGVLVLAPKDRLSYVARRDESGQVTLASVPRESLLPEDPGVSSAPTEGADPPDNSTADGDEIISGSVPILESLPGASAVIYLDFDGFVTTGTRWNSIKKVEPIVSGPAVLTSGQMREIWLRTAESFRTFTINVTTNPDVFNSGTAGRRMRVVITPDNFYDTSYGGVAFIAGWSFQEEPCFAFTGQLANGPFYIASAAAHEVGHTLGLQHDGTPSASYYSGHGVWAPIMGSAYFKRIGQWSKGEYSSANNAQDDLTIMDFYAGVDVRPDVVGGTISLARTLAPVSNSISYTGLIETASDKDVFAFTTATGGVQIRVQTMLSVASYLSDEAGALNIGAVLYDATGVVIATSDPVSSGSATNMNANFGTLNLTAGTYYLAVDGVGELSPLNTGFSDYGSIGEYSIEIQLAPNSPSGPTVTPTPTSTVTPTATPKSTSTATPTVTPSPTPTQVPPPSTPSATPSPTPTSTSTPVATATVAETSTPAPTTTGTATITASPTASATASATATATATVTVTETPTATATATVTQTPTVPQAAPPQSTGVVCDEKEVFDGEFVAYAETPRLGGMFTLPDPNVVQLKGDIGVAYRLPTLITRETILRVSFRSITGGHNINVGFDTDLIPSQQYNFQLYGAKRWGAIGYRAEYPGSSTVGDVQIFDIPVGLYYTGEFGFLTFVNNHNVRVPAAESAFSVQLCRNTLGGTVEPAVCGIESTCRGRRCTVRVRAADPTGRRGLGPVRVAALQLTANGSKAPVEVAATLRSQNDRSALYAFTSPISSVNGNLTVVMDGGQCSGGVVRLSRPKSQSKFSRLLRVEHR